MAVSHPFILAGKRRSGRSQAEVVDKFSGKAFARVAQGDSRCVETAIEAGARAAAAGREWPSFARAQSLRRLASAVELNRKRFEAILCREAGKPILDARIEVDRAILTCSIAAEEATRLTGEYQPLDVAERGVGYRAIIKRVPVGLCSMITPFNFPLNLVMHKVAPAIACGCPFILKPAPQAPLTALLLGELMLECGLPGGYFSVLTVPVELAEPLVCDERIRLLSFTGSAKVGWALKSKAVKQHVMLELGGNAACIVDEGVDVDFAAQRIAAGAFAQSGQSCISVQRVLIHQSMYQSLKRQLTRRVKSLRMGNPRLTSTVVGPLITEADADRVVEWIHEAKSLGANVVCGGRKPARTARYNPFVEPTIVENPPRNSKLWSEEVFGPVLTIESFDRFESAIEAANDSRYGLQAGILTTSLGRALEAWDRLEVGAVIVNDVPSVRIDSMPYGGVKDSGLGREGIRSAILSMTEERALVVRTPELSRR